MVALAGNKTVEVVLAPWRSRRAIVDGASDISVLFFPESGDRLSSDVDAALLDLSTRGIVTNALGPQAKWGRKDTLEYALREHHRSGVSRIERPHTEVIHPKQLESTLRAFSAAGRVAVVKSPNGARGEEVRMVKPHESVPAVRCGSSIVVQELVTNPVLVEGRKMDVRAYLIVDPDDVRGSFVCRPLFGKIAGRPYEPGVEDAEITNCSRRERLGLAGGMAPLESIDGLDADACRQIDDQADILLRALADAVARQSTPGNGRRALLWGIDLAVVRHDSRIAVKLLEINVHPHLIIGCSRSDPPMRRILADDYAPRMSRFNGVRR